MGRDDTPESQREAARYFQFAGVMMVAIDAHELVTGINRLGCELLGLSEAEILGENWFDRFLPERIRDDVRAAFRKLMAGEIEPVEFYENPVVTSDGEERVVEWHNRVLRDANDRIVGTLSAGTDVTERKELDRKLIERESLARLGEMAAVVAHEVRNPLAGISGSLQVVARGMPEGSPHLHVIGEIQDRIRTLSATIDDLLLYSRPLRPRPLPVAVSAILGQATGWLQRDPELGGVEVHTPDTEAVVRADPGLVPQVFLNLLLNAAQAMGGEGRIRIEVDEGRDVCSVTVADAGPGVPEDAREKVFEPFYTTKARGTGLGLPTARRILEAHGGGIELKESPEGGSAFVVRLPVAPDPTGGRP